MSYPATHRQNVYDGAEGLLTQVAATTNESLGVNGGVLISSANGAVTGNFRAIKALGGDVVISAATGNILTPAGASGLAGRTISDGDHVVGTFSSVTLTSGYAILYNI